MIHPKTMYTDKESTAVNPAEVLYNAIILQAVKDFRMARKRLKRNADDKAACAAVREISRFFRSRYFSVLTQVDGPTLLRRLSEEK